MPANPNWDRWILASISKHFDDRREGVTLFIEGQIRDRPAPPELLELRVDGPHLTEQTKGCWRAYVEVNILLQITMDGKNYHRVNAVSGLVASAFTDIPIFRYGDSVDDDKTQLGCLQLISDGIRSNKFGQVDATVPLVQASVEGHYELYLDEE